EQARSSPEHGGVIEGSDGLLRIVAADAINVIAVGGKRKSSVPSCERRDDLRVASRRNVPEPEGLQAILIENMKQVFSIGGNSGEEDVTIVGEVFGGHLCDGQDFFAWEEGVDAERSGDEQQDNDSQQESRAEFVLARSGDKDGTAGGYMRRLSGSDGRRG